MFFDKVSGRKKIKIGIVTSKGGHLFQLTKINRLIRKYQRFWVTDKGHDTDQFLSNERVYFGFFPESRNVPNFFKNIFVAFRILKREKPKVLMSCGAGIAVPFFLIGKYLFHEKLIYIEPFDFVAFPSLTGRIVYNFVDLFIIQQHVQKKWYPKAKYWGSLL